MVIFTGNLNVAYNEKDVYDPKKKKIKFQDILHKKEKFLKISVLKMNISIYRNHYPEKILHTYWT
jgi:exonuclease III